MESKQFSKYDARRVIEMYNIPKHDMRRVAMSVRVSTLHEQQVNALENQKEWVIDLARSHKDWLFDEETDLYIEQGLSGTSMKKRPDFKKMIDNAKAGMYDLLVVREVSRFMRNAKITLNLVDELLGCGVEVYFVNDNIWTTNPDDYFKLVIMAQYAEQESRKISERVFAGQSIARKNGVLLGNGNILGYDLIKGKKGEMTKYVINEEQAKIVRTIYDMALEGKGIKTIRAYLIDNGIKSSQGKDTWHDSTIERILRRPTYKGYIEYMQSVTENPLTHKRTNVDKQQRLLIKCDAIPVIIPPKKWDDVQEAINSRIKFTVDGKKTGNKCCDDIYCNKLRCGCGRKFRRDYEKRKGMSTYRCYRLVDDGTVKRRLEKSMLSKDNCSIYGIRDWKLDFYSLSVFRYFNLDIDEIKKKVLTIIDNAYTEECGSRCSEDDIARYKAEIVKYEKKNKSLLDALEDETIDKSTFKERYEKNKRFIAERELLIKQLEDNDRKVSHKQETLKKASEYIDKHFRFPKIGGKEVKVPDTLIDTYVNSIKVCADNIIEYNIRVNPDAEVQVPVVPANEFNPQIHSAEYFIDNTNAVLVQEIQLTYEDAKQYANKLNKKVVRVHFEKPVTIRVYVNF